MSKINSEVTIRFSMVLDKYLCVCKDNFKCYTHSHLLLGVDDP